MITCGNCHEPHPTVDDVRACYGAKPTQVQPTEVVTTAKYGRGAPDFDRITGPQLTFLNKLLDERPAYRDVENLWPDNIAWLTKREASSKIDEILKNVPKEAMKDPRPDVPEGRYALPNVGGKDEALVFYQVDKPTKGRWAGHVFVAQLVGSPGAFTEQRVNKATVASVLDRIAVEVVEAALRFSRKFTVCARCLSPLSQVRSRATGFGPTCADHLGVRYLPRHEALIRLNELGLSLDGLEDLTDENGQIPMELEDAWYGEPDAPTCSICDGYHGNGVCPLEDSGRYDGEPSWAL